MYKLNNLYNNGNLNKIDELGNVSVYEYDKDLSVIPENAEMSYFSSKMNIHR